MIDTPEDRANDVRPIRPERPADTLIERETAAPTTRPVTVVAVVPVDEIISTLHYIVYQAVAAAIITVVLGAAIGLVTLRRDNDR
jgi:hypothetical protein